MDDESSSEDCIDIIGDTGGTECTYEDQRSICIPMRIVDQTFRVRNMSPDHRLLRELVLVLAREYVDVLSITCVCSTSASIGWTSYDPEYIRSVLSQLVDLRALLHHRCILGDTGSSL